MSPFSFMGFRGCPLALQFLGHDGVAAAGAGKACDLGEGADLHGTLACTLDLKDAAGKLALRDEALVGGIVQDDGIVLAGVVHPCFQLCAGVGSAGGVVGAADIDDICLHALVRHAKEAIFLPGAAVNNLAAIGDVIVHIGGVHGIRHQHGVIHIEQPQQVCKVALGAVRDKDLVLGDLGAAAGVVALNGLLEEGVALLRAVAVEALFGAHLLGSVAHGLHHTLCQRLGHIADAQTDDLLFRVCFLICSYLVGNVHEQVAGLQFVVMLVHLHDTFPRFFY